MLISRRAGFTKEAHLLDRLESPDDGVGRFLLVCILALAAPFTESLIRRYDGALQASEFFAAQARALALCEQYTPNLENTQAFFLLGIYEWAHGCGQLGWVSDCFRLCFLRVSAQDRWVDANGHRGTKYVTVFSEYGTFTYICPSVAGILKLHRESTYDLPENATAEERIASESARRT